MVLSKEDLAVIKTCFLEKNWRGAEICRQFKNKGWKVRTVNYAINKLEKNENIYRKEGSGRPDTATSAENTQQVDDLVQSQENGGPIKKHFG